MTAGKLYRFKEKIKSKMERTIISPELQGFTEEEIQPLVPVPGYFHSEAVTSTSIDTRQASISSTNVGGAIITMKIKKSLGNEIND